MLKIIGAKVIVTCPGRNFVTLKIETSDGVHGLGDATLNGRELAVASYLTDHVIPCLIGRDAHTIEDIWQFLYRGAYWRRGPVTMAAIAAVDTALWDIKAKVAGLPLYQLLGGASRTGCMVYGHANGATVDKTVEAALGYQAEGYRAIRLQSGVPGLSSTYGVSKDKYFYEPADAALPTENVWSTEKYLRSVPELFRTAREALGWDVHLLHDAHHRLTPIEAGRLGKDLEPYRPFWLEDAVAADNQANFRLIRQHTTTPLAVGEVFNSIWDAKQLIEEQLIDYIRATIVHAGGITHLRRIASFADLHNVRTGCHGATDLSPVSMAAALHFGLSVPNFGIQEYMRHTAETDAVFPHAYSFDRGLMHPGEVPGLGVDLDEDLAAQYEYKPAYLPVNRLEDGTMWELVTVASKIASSEAKQRTSLTINDVARIAGVSKKTVSRVINSSPRLNVDTRRHVEGVIAELGYKPNPQARALARGQNFLIGLVHGNPNAQTVMNVQHGMLEALRDSEFEMVVRPLDRASPTILDDLRDFIERQRLFGVMLMPPLSENDAVAQVCADLGCRYVRMGSTMLDTPERSVTSNDRDAVRQATAHLIALGHRRIGLVAGPRGFQSAAERRLGFEDALRAAGLPLYLEMVTGGDYLFESGVRAGNDLLALADPPTAVFACNDEMAAGVIHAAWRRGLDVPRDLSVIGFDGAPIAEHLWPPLTTVRWPIASMARAATLKLIAAVEDWGGGTSEPSHFPSTLIHRASVAPPAAAAEPT